MATDLVFFSGSPDAVAHPNLLRARTLEIAQALPAGEDDAVREDERQRHRELRAGITRIWLSPESRRAALLGDFSVRPPMYPSDVTGMIGFLMSDVLPNGRDQVLRNLAERLRLLTRDEARSSEDCEQITKLQYITVIRTLEAEGQRRA